MSMTPRHCRRRLTPNERVALKSLFRFLFMLGLTIAWPPAGIIALVVILAVLAIRSITR